MICVVCVALAATAPSAAGVVDRRGTAGTVEGAVLRAGPEGVVVRVGRNGIDREETVAWSDVRSVDGATIAGLDAWQHAGEALWRGRTRVLRGDWTLALAPLEQAAAAWRGSAPCTDGLASALALTQAYVRTGRLADALATSYEAMRQLRAGIAAPEWVQGALVYVDAPRGLPAAVPPMALSAEDSRRAASALRAFDAGGDAALAQTASAYAALLADDSGSTRSPRTARTSEADRQGLAFLDALRDAQGPDATARAAARRNLAGIRRSLPVWCDAWVRYATGASLAAESDTSSRERGAVLLLSVDAVDSAAQPALAAAARERAAAALVALKDPAAAERVRRASPDAPEVPHR